MRAAGLCTPLAALLLVCGAAPAAAPAGRPAPVSAPAAEFFEKHVRPVLVEHCHSCHGPKKRRGGLRLDSRAGLLKGGDSGAAVVPGQPEKSLLVRAVRHEGDLK